MCFKKQVAVIAAVLISCSSLAQTSGMIYPETRRVEQSDMYFDVKVDDPYRWLENDTAADVADWVQRQSDFTNDYLSKIPFRSKVKTRISQLSNFPKYGIPVVAGNRYFYTKNDGLQNQPVIYSLEVGKEPVVFIDPNKLSPDGTTAISLIDFSTDDKYVAYSINESGSDWQMIKVMTTDGKELDDELKFVKFSSVAWHRDGFYYSRYPEPDEATKLSRTNENHQIYYHKLGTPQSSDQLIFQDAKNPLRYYQPQVTEDGRYLLIYVFQGSSGMELLYKDLRKAGSQFNVLFKGFDHEYFVLGNVGDELIVKTNDGAPNNSIISINPVLKKKKVLIPGTAVKLEEASVIGGFIFCNYLENVSSHIYQYSLKGKKLAAINLPGNYSAVTGFYGKMNSKETFFSITSFAYPAVIYKFNIASKIHVPFFKSELRYKPEDYITEQVFYSSKDGTKVPMFISYKKGLKKSGGNPAMLYAYGGFGVNLTPAFSATRIAWMEQGGIFAQPNLRGGGEYGEAWHKAGMLLNKQNVFDDFIAAAEYLVNENYTSPSKLAITGGSNGGLLVGAVTNQRPDLFRAAVPQVGVMDMLRYHKFTIGWAWATEYGTSDSLASFQNIYKYSPLHNIRETEYPSVIVTTADHDDRVVPAHSFKYIAELQSKQKGANPVLIRVDIKAGHGTGKSLSKTIDEHADIYSFLWNEMGVTPDFPTIRTQN